MYFGIENLIVNISRCGVSFILVFVLFPLVLFKIDGDGLDGFIVRYVKMVCLIVSLCYLLVLIKLYELISLLVVLVLLSAYNKFLEGKKKEHLIETGADLVTSFYAFLESPGKKQKLLVCCGKKLTDSVKNTFYHMFSSFEAVADTLLFAAIFLYSGYLRFYDAVRHVAPAMSDAYVTLAWVKYIEKRILFHDGIYPQAFHIYLSVLHKFAANDPLYILKYTGPLNGVFITLGIYFAVSRFTGRAMPGLIAAFIYGVLGGFLPVGDEWERQVSTNSQEFAMVFLMPALYYAASYIKMPKKSTMVAAFASFMVIGLVHSLIFLYLGIGIFFLIAANLLVNLKGSLKLVWEIGLAAVAAGVLSVVPVVLGLLMGRHFHNSSAEFLTSKLEDTIPNITVFDQIALVGFLLFFIVSIVIRKSKKDSVFGLYFLLLGIASFIMYMILGHLTGNAVLASRIGVLWGMMVPVGAGLGWFALFRILPGDRIKPVAEIVLFVIVAVCAVVYLKPTPAVPYKMQYDSEVEQYLRISEQFTPTEWMIVSPEEGYDLALGRGWHLMLGDFLSRYDPEKRRLVSSVDGRMEVLLTPDIFIFKQKNLFRVDLKAMEPILARREKEYKLLDIWLEKYSRNRNNVSVFYEDRDIQIIRINQLRMRDEVFKETLGGEGEKQTPETQ